MRVSPISVCYGTKLNIHSKLSNNESASKDVIKRTSHQNVNFKGWTGKILGGVAGAVVATAATALTGGALAPYFVVAGALWGDKEEEDYKNNNKKKGK